MWYTIGSGSPYGKIGFLGDEQVNLAAGFAVGFPYWTSSQSGDNFAMFFDSYHGYSYFEYKSYTFRVRVIRDFNYKIL